MKESGAHCCSVVWILVLTILGPIASAQQFTAAAVKPGSPSAECLSRVGQTEMNLTDCTLRFFVFWAWDIQPWQRFINRGPAWVLSDRFSIRAKASRPFQNRRGVDPMLKRLLEDRFGLVWRYEKQEAPVFFLSVPKSGKKIKPTPAGDCVSADSAGPPGPSSSGNCGLRAVYTPDGEAILLDGRGVAMADLVRELSFLLGREVVDRTGLSGRYDISIHFARDSSMSSGSLVLPPPKEFSSKFPGVFTAMRRFGLEFKAGKAPVEVFVVVHAQKPSAN
jgi:uncharacterized protein (TIGR03435 family)